MAARLLRAVKNLSGIETSKYSVMFCNSIAINTKIRENSPDTNPLICVHIYKPAKVPEKERSVMNKTGDTISSDFIYT